MADDIAMQAMEYVGSIGPLLLLIGGISFADLTLFTLIKLFKKMKTEKGGIKW